MASAMRAATGHGGANGASSSGLAVELASIAEEADLSYLEEHMPEALDRSRTA